MLLQPPDSIPPHPTPSLPLGRTLPYCTVVQHGGDAEDKLCPSPSPTPSTTPHLQLRHLLARAKPIPQLLLMGLIRYQRKGTEKQAVHLHQGRERSCRTRQEHRYPFAQPWPSMGWQHRASPIWVSTDPHPGGLVVMAQSGLGRGHSLGQCGLLEAWACSPVRSPTSQRPSSPTSRRPSPTSRRSMLEPRSSSAVLLGRDRFCVRKWCSSPWSLAAHANVKSDPGKEQGRGLREAHQHQGHGTAPCRPLPPHR